MNEAEQEQLLEQLRIMVLSDQTIGIAKTLLDKTEILREKLVQEENVNLLTHFPYFFTCPKLVCSIIINHGTVSFALSTILYTPRTD